MAALAFAFVGDGSVRRGAVDARVGALGSGDWRAGALCVCLWMERPLLPFAIECKNVTGGFSVGAMAGAPQRMKHANAYLE